MSLEWAPPQFAEASVIPCLLVLTNAPAPTGHRVALGRATSVRGEALDIRWTRVRQDSWLDLCQGPWPLLLERILDDPAAQRIECLNLGVVGYNLIQYAALLEQRGAELQPDAVVVGICLNDFASHMVVGEDGDETTLSFFIRHYPVAVDLGEPVNYWLFEHSILWRRLNERLAQWTDVEEPRVDLNGERAKAAAQQSRQDQA